MLEYRKVFLTTAMRCLSIWQAGNNMKNIHRIWYGVIVWIPTKKTTLLEAGMQKQSLESLPRFLERLGLDEEPLMKPPSWSPFSPGRNPSAACTSWQPTWPMIPRLSPHPGAPAAAVSWSGRCITCRKALTRSGSAAGTLRPASSIKPMSCLLQYPIRCLSTCSAGLMNLFLRPHLGHG